MKTVSVFSGLLLGGAASLFAASPWEVITSSRYGGDWVVSEASGEATEAGHVIEVLDTPVNGRPIIGIGGAFTESAGYALAQVSSERRAEVLRQCFSSEGAWYSLMRTHIGSCDFSLENYDYVDDGDRELNSFSVERDERYLLPLIRDAQAVDGARFRTLASPWTPPPWMKDNGAWNGGKLLPENYDLFSRYLVRYLRAYETAGAPIWAITPMNEPEGNGSNWESCEFTAEEMAAFVGMSLGPVLREEKLDTKVFMFDQNRDHVEHWVEVFQKDAAARPAIDGAAVHWYSNTVDPLPKVLESVAAAFPDKDLMHTEGCIDALGDDEPMDSWLERDWYWRADATDWGWIWAPDELKPDHPKYIPVSRYAKDLIVGLNSGMTGWIDWNLCLDFRGGPNHASNFCGAPILVDGKTDTAFYTPLYYALRHVSRFARPGAIVLQLSGVPQGIVATAVRNEDGSVAFIAYNEGAKEASLSLKIGDTARSVAMPAQSLVTVVSKK